LCGRAGFRVVLCDSDPTAAAARVACGTDCVCRSDNLRVAVRWPDETLLPADVVLLDCPSLTETAGQQALEQADGVVLTSLAEPLALRTLPVATQALARAQAARPRLAFHGIVLALWQPQDPWQTELLAELRASYGELLLEPPIPCQRDLRAWPLRPGSDLPLGEAASAYRALSEQLQGQLALRPLANEPV